MQFWIENEYYLKKVLKGLTPVYEPIKFDVWKTIKIGPGVVESDDFLKALAENGCCTSGWARSVLNNIYSFLYQHSKEVNLALVTMPELGFEKGVRFKYIYDRAQKLGLKPCPAEVGPLLRMQYKDQPAGERLQIAMEPVLSLGGDRSEYSIFDVRNKVNDLFLDCSYSTPDNFWDERALWVFCQD